MNATIRIGSGRASALLACVVSLAACGSKQATPAQTAGSAAAAPGAKPGDGSKAVATKQEVASFADTVKKYEPLRGKTDSASCSQAMDIWSKAANDNEKIVEARYNLGAIQEACGDLKGAEESYKKALAIKSDFAPAEAGLGSIAAKKGDMGEAERLALQTLAKDKANPTAHRNVAMLMLQKARAARNVSGMSKEIVEHLRYALAADSKDVASYTTIALVYYFEAAERGFEKAKLELAQLACDQASKVNDKAAQPYNVLGMVLLGKKNVTAGLANFRKAVELDPNLAEGWMNIGAVTLSFRDYAGAEAAFRKVIALQPNNVEAIVGLGVALRGAKKFDEAEAQYKAAEKIDARNCSIPFNLGLLYQDYKGAQEAALRQAQTYFRDFVSRCGAQQVAKVKEAEVRIKNIDETIDAIKNAAVLQKQAEEAARRSEEEAKKAAGGGAAPAGGAPAAGDKGAAPPASGAGDKGAKPDAKAPAPAPAPAPKK